jgi:hypothetical protein
MRTRLATLYRTADRAPATVLAATLADAYSIRTGAA